MADGICNACGTALAGEYCHRCGQREADTDWRSIGAIARQFWNELVNLDFKTVRSLGALFVPGYLAAEFIAGRRTRYLGPLKLYFLTAALFFLIAPRVSDFNFERQMALDQTGEFRARVEARIASTKMNRELFAERFNARLQTIYTLAPIFSVLAAALILRMLFGRRFPWPGPHAVVAVYHVALMFLVALVMHAVNDAFDGVNLWILVAGYLAGVGPIVYLTLRRVYGEPPTRTAWKSAAVLLLAFLLDIPVNVAALRLSIGLT